MEQAKTKDEQGYNGWKNYETWNVKLWLDDEQDTQELQKEWLFQAKAAPKNKVWTREETTRFTLSDIIKAYVQENTPEAPPSMYSDLLDSAISEVNWQEIADNILSDR